MEYRVRVGENKGRSLGILKYSVVPHRSEGQTDKESACNERDRFNPWVRKISWRRECLPTSLFLPGELHGQRSLSGCSPWGLKESDMTERLTLYFTILI